jgi:HK97 family phage portal protein
MPGLFAGLQNNLLTNEAAWVTGNSWFGTPSAGEPVTSGTALTLSTWYACIRNQSEDIAKLPVHVFRYVDDKNKQREDSHPVARLFSVSPNTYQTPITFRAQMTHFMLGWGNAYAEIERDSFQNPIGLHPLHPAHVLPEWDNVARRVRYKVNKFDLDGSIVINSRIEYVDSDNMFHLRGLGDHALYGYSVIRVAAETISMSLAAERFGASYFKNKGAISGTVTHNGVMDDKSRDNFTASFNEAYRGARNAGGWILLEDGMKYEALNINPDDAQFLQTRILQIEEICRIMRMPPSKIQHLAKANYNSLEMQNLDYVIDTLQGTTIKWQQEAKRKLFRSDEADMVIDHNFGMFLKGDSKAQTEHLRAMMNNGVYSPNEARQFLGQNSIGPEGDKRFVAVNMMELKPDMVSPSEAKAARQPAPREPRGSMTYTQAHAVISPVIVRSQRKADKAIERLEKKHDGDPEALIVAVNDLMETIKTEMTDNVKEFWNAIGGNDDDLILVIQGGQTSYVDYEEITGKLARLIAGDERN